MKSSKQDLFQRLQNERSNILELLNEINGKKGKFHLIGNWTIFDVLSHLAGWAVWRVNALKELLQTDHTDFSHLINIDKFNADNVKYRVNHSWEQVVQEVEYADQQWISLLNSLSEEDIFDSTRFKGPVWETLADWIHIAIDHYTDHARDINFK